MTIYNTRDKSDASMWFLRGLDAEFMKPEDHIDYIDPVSPWSWKEARLRAGEQMDPGLPIPRKVVFLDDQHYFLSANSDQAHRIFEAPAVQGNQEPRKLEFQELADSMFQDLATDGKHLFALDQAAQGIWMYTFDHGGTSFHLLDPIFMGLPEGVALDSGSRFVAWFDENNLRALVWKSDQKGCRLYSGPPNQKLQAVPGPSWTADGRELNMPNLRIGDAIVAHDRLFFSLTDRSAVIAADLEKIESPDPGKSLELEVLVSHRTQPPIHVPSSLAFHDMDQISQQLETGMVGNFSPLLARRVRKQRHLVCLDRYSERALTINVTPLRDQGPKDSKDMVLPLLGHPKDSTPKADKRNLLTLSLKGQCVVPASDGGLLFGNLGESDWTLLRPRSVQLHTWLVNVFT